MPPRSGKRRKTQLKLKRAIKRGEAPPQPEHRKKTRPTAARTTRDLQSQFIKLDKAFLDHTRALAASIPLKRPIQSNVAVLRPEWIAPQIAQLTLPRRPKWRYQMSKDELDANEQAYFRTWLAQQDATVEQWQRALNVPAVTDHANPPADPVNDSETRQMPHPPTHFERNIEVWRQFWRVTEISQILLLLLDSRCPPLHLPSSLSTYLHILTPTQSDSSSRSKHSSKYKAPRVILVLTKVDISGPARTAAWTSFLNDNYPDIPVVPVEAYAPKSSVEQGPTRYEPHLPGSFRERLVHTLRDVHEQLLHPPHWVIAPREGESEDERLQRANQWRPRVKTAIDWGSVLRAKEKLVGKAVGGAAAPKGQDVQPESDGIGDVHFSDDEESGNAYEWKEPEFLTVGVIGQPNVGKSSLLNAIFGKTRVRASRTPGKTKHFQTLFWTSDIRLVDCPGLVMPSLAPMDIQVLSGVLPISRVSAVPFCVHQLAQFLPLEQILDLMHPSSTSSAVSTTSISNSAVAVTSMNHCGQSSESLSKAKTTLEPSSVNANSVKDKRTWRPGQRPPEQTEDRTRPPRWTANDIMTAYAEKKGWVTAKAGRPDIHRAGNAILRLVAEGKIPWAFWPPGNSVSGDDGIRLKDGVQQHAWDEFELDEDRDEGSEESEMEAFSNDEDVEAGNKITDESDDDDDDDDDEGDKFTFGGRFATLKID